MEKNKKSTEIENRDKYNGWSNRETWAVRLHWDNDAGIYNFFREEAKRYKNNKKYVHEFADFLEEYAEEIMDAVMEGTTNKDMKMFIRDVGSLWRVNWWEIAKSYYNEVEDGEKKSPPPSPPLKNNKKNVHVAKKKGVFMQKHKKKYTFLKDTKLLLLLLLIKTT